MQGLAESLEQLIGQGKPALESMMPAILSEKPLPHKWSKKEIIGHMIDSGHSNIRRFIIAQYEDRPHIVYNQDKWVASSDYQHWDEKELINLWYLLNKQICHILRNMPESAAKRQCSTESLHTIEWLAEDYLKHLQHHLRQVVGWEPVPYP